MKFYKSLFFGFSTLFIVISAISAYSAESLSPAEITVHWFCMLDAAGARLSGKTAGFVNPFMEEEQLAGPDTVVVIKSYSVVREELTGDTATISVDYDVMGESARATGFVEGRKRKTYKFQLKMMDGVWKIVRYPLFAHVYQETLESHVESLGKDCPKGKEKMKLAPINTPTPGTPTP